MLNQEFRFSWFYPKTENSKGSMTKLFGWKEVTTDWFSIIIGWTPGNCEGNKPVSEKWFEGIEPIL